MISHPDRVRAVTLINEAMESGARQWCACETLGISERTYRRWVTQGNEVSADKRPNAFRPSPTNKLSDRERQEALSICHEPRFSSVPPGQIVPVLTDEGCYVASESTFYRLLREADEQHHRGRAKAPATPRAKPTHSASAPCEVWCWDVTWLKSPLRGMFYYLYLILDLYSRKIVGWEVHENESGEKASLLVTQAVLSEQCISKPLVLHADNGSIQKGSTLRETLKRLDIEPSFSRPRVSDDNAYPESLFRTAKYRPDFPVDGFASLEVARVWVMRFVQWYNNEHRHSGIQYVTPIQRHTGEDIAILTKRHELYEQAKAANPQRWSGNTRNWERQQTTWLNPVSETEKLLDSV